MLQIQLQRKQLLSLKNRSFIEKMIHEGKKMYLLDMYLPTISDKLKIGFSEENLIGQLQTKKISGNIS